MWCFDAGKWCIRLIGDRNNLEYVLCIPVNKHFLCDMSRASVDICSQYCGGSNCHSMNSVSCFVIVVV